MRAEAPAKAGTALLAPAQYGATTSARSRRETSGTVMPGIALHRSPSCGRAFGKGHGGAAVVAAGHSGRAGAPQSEPRRAARAPQSSVSPPDECAWRHPCGASKHVLWAKPALSPTGRISCTRSQHHTDGVASSCHLRAGRQRLPAEAILRRGTSQCDRQHMPLIARQQRTLALTTSHAARSYGLVQEPRPVRLRRSGGNRRRTIGGLSSAGSMSWQHAACPAMPRVSGLRQAASSRSVAA
jgi:hypothetical protein